MARKGSAFRERRDRGNITEAQRHSVRVRIKRSAHELAAAAAESLGVDVADVIAKAIEAVHGGIKQAGREASRDEEVAR